MNTQNGEQGPRLPLRVWLWMVPPTIVGLIVVLALVASLMDGAGQRVEYRDRCLKHADTAYDAARC